MVAGKGGWEGGGGGGRERIWIATRPKTGCEGDKSENEHVR